MSNLIKYSFNKKIDDFVSACDVISQKNYFTNVYGLARSVLAFGLLCTLIFSDKLVLYPKHLYSNSEIVYFMKEYNLFFLFGYENYFYSLLIAIIILLLVISGYFPRYTGILHWWVTFSFVNSCLLIDGGDQITAILTLMLIPITLLDNRKNHWQRKEKNNKYSNFFAYCIFLVIELQVAIVYLQSSIEKPYKVDEWLNGTAFYYWINDNTFGANDFILSFLNPLIEVPFFVSLFTWGAIIFELCLFGIFFMNRDKRIKFFKYAVAFHFMIIVFHGLFSFFFAMLGALILYLIPKNYNLKNPLHTTMYKNNSGFSAKSKVSNI